MYVPYDNFKINDPAIKYKDLIKPNTTNPDYERYALHRVWRSEEHTSELQSLMRTSYAVFCLNNNTPIKPQDALLPLPTNLHHTTHPSKASQSHQHSTQRKQPTH